MKSKNFEYLRDRNSELADLGGFAELYVYTDPSTSLTKLRLFGENLVADFLYSKQIRPSSSSFSDMLRDIQEADLAPNVVLNKLHYIRKTGNTAAHNSRIKITPETATTALQTAFELGKWFNIAAYNNHSFNNLVFQEPVVEDTKGKLKKDKKAALQKICQQQQQMDKLLEELEIQRNKVKEVQRSKAELKQLVSHSKQATDTLQFSEDETRKLLIDQQLIEAGWNVGGNGTDSDDVKQEFKVDGQPTPSGNGYIDYVLWDSEDGKPMAIIEAKKTYLDAEKGRKQAGLYADALENKYKVRPLIFITNGYDIKILDDAKRHVPRQIYGYYAKESLQRLLWQTNTREFLLDCPHNDQIIDRMYQIEAVKRVCENFNDNKRKALIVLATGTGKTRVAIALSDILIRCKWAKRILFLCDRRELRKQAYNAFGDHIPSESRVYVTAATSDDRNKRIYFATYPAMMKCFQNFDVGFFDLIIADESHRSIYNRYRSLFLYFDTYHLGLTATPRNVISHNTYKLFGCDDQNPTAWFGYNDAIKHEPPYLVPFKPVKCTTQFLRNGIKYAEMTNEQKKEADEQVLDPELIDYSKEAVSSTVFNKGTDKLIIRQLMEDGVKDADGRLGKTIIFARNHKHALQLLAVFEELYPQYMDSNGEFCNVIDSKMERTDDLIDDFKGFGNNGNLTIAISVDMLDTGIDIPKIVNLVFAKPVKSLVKFWQMIGRGTRLCENLFGEGQHKEYFQIFDYWNNFEYFGENPEEIKPSLTKPIIRKVFEKRLDLAIAAIKYQDVQSFEIMTALIDKDVKSLPEDSIAVREKWREVQMIKQEGVIYKFDDSTQKLLYGVIAPLMMWINLVRGTESAYRFDLLIGQLQESRMNNDSKFDDFKDIICNQIGELPINITQVKAKIDWLKKVKTEDFWTNSSIADFEKLRTNIRGIMKYRTTTPNPKSQPLYLDIKDNVIEITDIRPEFGGQEQAVYLVKMIETLEDMSCDNSFIDKIKAGKPVTEQEITDLSRKFKEYGKEDKITLRKAAEDLSFGKYDDSLSSALTKLDGATAEKVNQIFVEFIQKNPGLSSNQIRFLEMIKRHISEYGSMQLVQLYQAPFTSIHGDGIDGVFSKETMMKAVINLVQTANSIILSA